MLYTITICIESVHCLGERDIITNWYIIIFVAVLNRCKICQSAKYRLLALPSQHSLFGTLPHWHTGKLVVPVTVGHTGTLTLYRTDTLAHCHTDTPTHYHTGTLHTVEIALLCTTQNFTARQWLHCT